MKIDEFALRRRQFCYISELMWGDKRKKKKKKNTFDKRRREIVLNFNLSIWGVRSI